MKWTGLLITLMVLSACTVSKPIKSEKYYENKILQVFMDSIYHQQSHYREVELQFDYIAKVKKEPLIDEVALGDYPSYPLLSWIHHSQDSIYSFEFSSLKGVKKLSFKKKARMNEKHKEIFSIQQDSILTSLLNHKDAEFIYGTDSKKIVNLMADSNAQLFLKKYPQTVVKDSLHYRPYRLQIITKKQAQLFNERLYFCFRNQELVFLSYSAFKYNKNTDVYKKQAYDLLLLK